MGPLLIHWARLISPPTYLQVSSASVQLLLDLPSAMSSACCSRSSSLFPLIPIGWGRRPPMLSLVLLVVSVVIRNSYSPVSPSVCICGMTLYDDSICYSVCYSVRSNAEFIKLLWCCFIQRHHRANCLISLWPNICNFMTVYPKPQL